MNRVALIVFVSFEILLTGGFFLLYPKIARKGLLFGVYVGEERAASDEARRITSRWYAAMFGLMAASLGAVVLVGLASPSPEAVLMLAPVLPVVCFFALYLRAYFAARALATPGAPPAAVASLETAGRGPVLLPALSLAFGVLCGIAAIAFAATHYDALPGRVPTHFGPSGKPDAWRDKSFFTVMLMPLLVLVLGVGLGGIAWLTAHAKRALRSADHGASLAAQLRFRAAMTRFLSITAILACGMITTIAIASIRVGLGEIEGLGPGPMVLAIGLVVWALGGTLYLAMRYGQGGSRLERVGPDTPLTNGLADNRHWVLGMFYVNRDDPSFLVEHRFGLGYTINLGNVKAVIALGAFLALVIGIAIVAVVTN